mgnify:CR=1 FL=1
MSTVGQRVWSLFPKCKGNRDILDLIALLGRMVEDLRAGNITEQDAKTFLSRVCPKLRLLFLSCGSPVDPGQCTEVLYDIITTEAYTRHLTSMYTAFLRSKKVTSGSSSSSGFPL